MSTPYAPPPPYEDVKGTFANKTSNSTWQAWYRKLISLDFNQDDASEYAKLFVQNEVELNMIPELNDNALKLIGIEKAGHRLRILRLQKSAPTSQASTTPARNDAAAEAVIIPRCAWHPDVAANEKCVKCNRLLCLSCRRGKAMDSRGTRYYCQNCYDDCVIL